jgi:Ca2+-binding EF-hand superfamily protein
VLQAVSDAVLAELKQCFLEAYDDNQDGKIDIREVSQCSKLPFQSILSSCGVIHGE